MIDAELSDEEEGFDVDDFHVQSDTKDDYEEIIAQLEKQEVVRVQTALGNFIHES